ncbi:MAG TPA: hypothetical protein VFQ53_01400 [Kofleriaceae bacterium]|nr:hypothetical protein [Kofleriaceae bacterium]
MLALAALALGAPDSTFAAPKKAAAGKPTVGACGAKVLPLVVGNQWTYSPIAAPQPIARELEKLAPAQPKQIVITVKSVEPGAGGTVATLEEKMTYEVTPANAEKKKPAVMAEVIVKSTISCSKDRFDISPDSFFFNAEPGGYRELAFDKFERAKAPNNTSWKLTNGTIGEAQWGEDIVAHFTRTPAKASNATMSAGKLEIERRFTPLVPETVVTKGGLNYKAEKLAIVTTGRITLDAPVSPNPAQSELPKGWINTIWMVDNVGVVQTLNMYAHMYQLTDVQLK